MGTEVVSSTYVNFPKRNQTGFSQKSLYKDDLVDINNVPSKIRTCIQGQGVTSDKHW